MVEGDVVVVDINMLITLFCQKARHVLLLHILIGLIRSSGVWRRKPCFTVEDLCQAYLC